MCDCVPEVCPVCKREDFTAHLGWAECHHCGHEWSIPLCEHDEQVEESE